MVRRLSSLLYTKDVSEVFLIVLLCMTNTNGFSTVHIAYMLLDGQELKFEFSFREQCCEPVVRKY
jgi:hypothetical protein